ncbi:hypothetical protein AB0F13_20855 [Streptomyces sp. NPDC026206]|uniref:hypothetical protein n=1 Tax=Streptomyces sp. NPDC026206 TaxID=3157089 RepID=UPI0033DEEF72
METWQELSSAVENHLADASIGERCIFAAGVAERLMRRHEGLPEEDQEPFTLSLRPLLDSVWEGALGDSTAFTHIKRGVGEFLLSDYCHNDGQDGPDEADESTAAAVLHAAETYLYGCADFATWVSERAVQAVDQHLEYLADQSDDGILDDPDEAVTSELLRQLRDLELIAGYGKELRQSSRGLSIDTSARLRAELRAPLSRQDLDTADQ